MTSRRPCLDPALIAVMRNPTVDGALSFYEPFRRKMGGKISGNFQASPLFSNLMIMKQSDATSTLIPKGPKLGGERV